MFFHMRRRGRVRLVSYLCAAFVVLGGIALREHNRSVQLQRAVTNSYLHAFSEVTDSLDQMDTALQKGVYVTSAPMLCSLCDQVYAQATAAQLALGQLPFSNVELEQTASFVATVGDYAQSLSRQAAVEGACPEGENRENWKELSAAARQLSDQLNELELQLFDGSFTIDNVAQAEERLSQSQSTTGETDLSGFKKVEAEFPEMPSLIYDGPFSQHLTGRKPAATEGHGGKTADRLGGSDRDRPGRGHPARLYLYRSRRGENGTDYPAGRPAPLLLYPRHTRGGNACRRRGGPKGPGIFGLPWSGGNGGELLLCPQ